MPPRPSVRPGGNVLEQRTLGIDPQLERSADVPIHRHDRIDPSQCIGRQVCIDVEKQQDLPCGFSGSRIHLPTPTPLANQADHTIIANRLDRAALGIAVDHDDLAGPLELLGPESFQAVTDLRLLIDHRAGLGPEPDTDVPLA